MSEFVLKEGNGSIFRNKKKTSEKQPDFKGEIKINNIVYEFGVWEKRSDKGTVWLSIGGARPKQDKGEEKTLGAAYDASVNIGNKTISAKQVISSMRDDVFGFGEDEDLVPF